MKKYEITDITQKAAFEENVTLHRIRALIDIPEQHVKAGDLGGWIESEANLSHDGSCWVAGNAFVFQNARVYGDALVGNKASVKGNAKIRGSALVGGNSSVRDDAIVEGEACVMNSACVFGDAVLKHSAKVRDNAQVSTGTITDNATIFDVASVTLGYTRAGGKPQKPYIGGSVKIGGRAIIRGNVYTYGYAHLGGSLVVNGREETVRIGNESRRAPVPTLLMGEITDGTIEHSTDIVVFGPVDLLGEVITYNTKTGSFTAFNVSEKHGKFKSRLIKRWGENPEWTYRKLALDFVDKMHEVYDKKED